MNKFFLIFLSIFLLTACSANNKSKFWSKKNTEKVNKQNEILFDNKKNLSEEIDKLNNLLKDGVITPEEFEKAKKKLLDN